VKVVPVPCLKDNYAWLIIPADGPLWVVDPGEAAPVLNSARGLGRPLGGVLLTHHHADHVGGVDGLRAAFPNLVVIGSREDAARLPRLDVALNPGRFEFGGMVGEMRAVPAHTKGHVAFIVDEFLFCGDTLFSGGCGRLFEGTPDELRIALYVTLADLPDETVVCCGHEYTLDNLRFARRLLPDNDAMAIREGHCKALRAANRPTVPTLLGEERQSNIFLRAHRPEVVKAIGFGPRTSVTNVLSALRRMKDNFRG
jgi:hydroxyacylglutathione hydrolase